MRLPLVLAAVSVGAVAAFVACGGDDTVIDLPDGSSDTSIDTIVVDDTGVPDTGPLPDTGVDDGGVTDATTTDGASTDGGGIRLRCGDASVTDCTQCNGAPQPCVYCGTTDASTLSGQCVQFHQNCLNTIPNGFEDCRCGPNGDASACPTKYQVCTTLNRCHTCSDQNSNNTLSCQGGGKCTYADGGCN